MEGLETTNKNNFIEYQISIKDYDKERLDPILASKLKLFLQCKSVSSNEKIKIIYNVNNWNRIYELQITNETELINICTFLCDVVLEGLYNHLDFSDYKLDYGCIFRKKTSDQKLENKVSAPNESIYRYIFEPVYRGGTLNQDKHGYEYELKVKGENTKPKEHTMMNKLKAEIEDIFIKNRFICNSLDIEKLLHEINKCKRIREIRYTLIMGEREIAGGTVI